jgi:rod shape-determining protein MreD
MRWPVLVILAYVLMVVQTTLFDRSLLALHLGDVWIKPDLLLLLALFVALVAEPAEVFMAAWSLGLAEDLVLQQGPLGVGALLFGLAAYLAALARGLLPVGRILSQVLLALGFVFAVRVAQVGVLSWLTDSQAGLGYVLGRSVGDAAYSAPLAPYVFWLLKKLAYRGNRLER